MMFHINVIVFIKINIDNSFIFKKYNIIITININKLYIYYKMMKPFGPRS